MDDDFKLHAGFTCLNQQVMSSTACRHVAAFSGSTETSYQISMFDCSDSKPQLLCQTRAHATQPSNEPWQIANCIRLESFKQVSFTFCSTCRHNDCTRPCMQLSQSAFQQPMGSICCAPQNCITVPCMTCMSVSTCCRDEPVLIMSSLIKPVILDQPPESGVNAWHHQHQRLELACHLSHATDPWCIAVAPGLMAAAGEHSPACCIATSRSVAAALLACGPMFLILLLASMLIL